MGLTDGKLAKMIILSYATDKEGNKKGIPRPFPVMYNPEKFSRQISNIYHSQNNPGSSDEEQAYERTEANKVSFEFMFDATGGSVNSIQGEVARELGGVDAQIELFQELTHKPDPDEHQPPKLTLVWGTFILDCRLTSATIEYLMFNSLGRPLRAKINAAFKGDTTRLIQAAVNKLFSADLTHVRVVKAGETLPLISHKVYGDSRYYLQIADLNGITNIRNLTPGTELILPPLEKLNN